MDGLITNRPAYAIGTGFDMHQLESGRKMILGNVEIPYHSGFLGFSDGDILIHALCDALLGAANLGDIGKFFPSSDEAFRDKESSFFLLEVMKKISENSYHIGNIDSTIILQNPKISDFVPKMKKKLSGLMNISENRISIKATTTDFLGVIGNEEAGAAQVVVLLESDT